jgi:hypothetical protein
MSTALLTKPTLTLADRLKIQQQRNRDRDCITVGRMSSVVFEAQRSTSGLSQSRPRYHNAEQARQFAAGSVNQAMAPFSEKQSVLWASITLDWLGLRQAPTLAVSRDGYDLLLPAGLTPLPDIPNPEWTPRHALAACPNSKDGCSGCLAPRIPQLLTGCPVCGDRVRDKITARDGRVYGVIHPILELCIVLPSGHFFKVRGAVDPADGTHLALLIDDNNPRQMQGYFVGGKFRFGG